MGNPKRQSSDRNEELHAAARSGDLNAVQTLCSTNPLAVNSRDKHSRTPLKNEMGFHKMGCRRVPRGVVKVISKVGMGFREVAKHICTIAAKGY
ncbi:hypothetical protein KY290_033243 [Solanum tuberosum]|uniref:Ankyrin repeat-containing protein n=1 Tax=Solanum tuberosum TaxID=4113 RepID=A0ABQ7U001_SOLTU|nr:hypothetical protein KY285_032500 [Solanum tuberosum]KAH0740200.1 hypothetical protein KY290_033243 [Solanum tuberosum]